MKCITCNGSGHYDSFNSPSCGACGGSGEELEEDKPWQGMIDMIQEMIDDWVNMGFDKERPDIFDKMQNNLARFKRKQDSALKII